MEDEEVYPCNDIVQQGALKMSKDHWSSEAYTKAAAFVPALTTKVLQYLDPKEDERILDIGCGDGQLTEKIAARCEEVVGLDSSKSFIKTAIEVVGSRRENATFAEMDCRRLKDAQVGQQLIQDGSYDKIFSNAALHWILADSSIRVAFFEKLHRLLKPGGRLVFEMGGKGNIAEVHSALIAVLRFSYQIPLERICDADPWFFPSESWMLKILERVGFEVSNVESEYRPTSFPHTSDRGSGPSGWIHLMCASFLELLPTEHQRDDAVRSVCEILRVVTTRFEDDSDWIGFVRLRAVAVKV